MFVNHDVNVFVISDFNLEFVIDSCNDLGAVLDRFKDSEGFSGLFFGNWFGKTSHFLGFTTDFLLCVATSHHSCDFFVLVGLTKNRSLAIFIALQNVAPNLFLGDMQPRILYSSFLFVQVNVHIRSCYYLVMASRSVDRRLNVKCEFVSVVVVYC